MQKVASNGQDWPLPHFFEELFDYCFPIDYWMQNRKRLARCSQGEKTITEYSHELQELFNMIRNISEQDQVLRVWNGVKAEIQSGLWRVQLNPEILSWDEVLAQAEIIEISENITYKWESKARTSGSCQDIVFMPRFPVNWINLPSSGAHSSRSMTFTSRK